MTDETIDILMSFDKNELTCNICMEPLTKQIFQCVNGPHYVCNSCELKLIKNECPTCKHPSRPVRNIYFENQIKPHLIPCTNIGCKEKFFKWCTEHECLFAHVNCRVCHRSVSSQVENYCQHLEGFCDEIFEKINVLSFEKRLKYKLGGISSILKLPNNILLIVKKTGHTYKISAVKNPDIDLKEFKNIICSYSRDGIEYNVTIPITNIGESKIADIFFNDNIPECIFSKDLIMKSKTQSSQNNDRSLRDSFNAQQNFSRNTRRGASGQNDLHNFIHNQNLHNFVDNQNLRNNVDLSNLFSFFSQR